MLAVAVYRVATGPRWLNRSAPLVSTPKPPEPKPIDPEKRLLFVVLDGMRADAIPLVPALKQFDHRADLVADLPTISAPQYVALLTGVPPEDSGRRSNEQITAAGLDSVPAVVRRAGGKTAAFSDCVDWWWQLFPETFDHRVRVDPIDPEALRSRQDAFTVVHLCAFDEAGHRSGAASADYRVQAAGRIDREMTALLAAWGDRGPVVVTADHGHRDGGGHGGDEPEVRNTFALFRGVDSAPLARGRAVDLAPTLSHLLGVPAPASSEGASLLERPSVLSPRRLLASVPSETLDRVGRALVVLLAAALCARALKGHRLGLAAGAGALATTSLLYLSQYSVSLSADRNYGRIVLAASLIGLGCTAVFALTPAWVIARRRGRDHALKFMLAAAAGASPIALAALATWGVATPRLWVGPGWSLALPSVANAAWAGSLLPLLVGAIAISATADR
jgi:hypothetical protein